MSLIEFTTATLIQTLHSPLSLIHNPNHWILLIFLCFQGPATAEVSYPNCLSSIFNTTTLKSFKNPEEKQVWSLSFSPRLSFPERLRRWWRIRKVSLQSPSSVSSSILLIQPDAVILMILHSRESQYCLSVEPKKWKSHDLFTNHQNDLTKNSFNSSEILWTWWRTLVSALLNPVVFQLTCQLIHQSEHSITITWSAWTNHRPELQSTSILGKVSKKRILSRSKTKKLSEFSIEPLVHPVDIRTNRFVEQVTTKLESFQADLKIHKNYWLNQPTSANFVNLLWLFTRQITTITSLFIS